MGPSILEKHDSKLMNLQTCHCFLTISINPVCKHVYKYLFVIPEEAILFTSGLKIPNTENL